MNSVVRILGQHTVPFHMVLSETCKSVQFGNKDLDGSPLKPHSLLSLDWDADHQKSLFASFILPLIRAYSAMEITAFGHFHLYDLVTVVYAVDSSVAKEVKVLIPTINLDLTIRKDILR